MINKYCHKIIITFLRFLLFKILQNLPKVHWYLLLFFFKFYHFLLENRDFFLFIFFHHFPSWPMALALRAFKPYWRQCVLCSPSATACWWWFSGMCSTNSRGEAAAAPAACQWCRWWCPCQCRCPPPFKCCLTIYIDFVFIYLFNCISWSYFVEKLFFLFLCGINNFFFLHISQLFFSISQISSLSFFDLSPLLMIPAYFYFIFKCWLNFLRYSF